ncbi:mating-type protein MAT alpha 1, partial [Lepidopterella palustris CBS 459.81]
MADLTPFEGFPTFLHNSPTLLDIQTYLATRSGEEMNKILGSIQDPAALKALTEFVFQIPPPVGTRAIVPGKTKKALNSYIAFRSYYLSSPEFASWQMKLLSSIMGKLWAEDLWKPKWTLAAKAWSTIRDEVGKASAPLDAFLNIACPLLGIIPPSQYLSRLGWEVSADGDGNPTVIRKFIPSQYSFAAFPLTTTLSADDVVNHCRVAGY